MTDNARDNDVRMAAYWLRKAVRARANAGMYPEYQNALEGLAELYAQMAERIIKLESSDKSSFGRAA